MNAEPDELPEPTASDMVTILLVVGVPIATPIILFYWRAFRNPDLTRMALQDPFGVMAETIVMAVFSITGVLALSAYITITGLYLVIFYAYGEANDRDPRNPGN